MNTNFKKICEELIALHDKKSHDYADDTDPYLNFNLNATLWHEKNWKVPLQRASEKLIRIAQLDANNKKPKNESMEDSIRDIAVLAIIALDLFKKDK